MGLYFHESMGTRRGPHVPNTPRWGVPADQDFRRLLARRLEENEQLQRIYGTA